MEVMENSCFYIYGATKHAALTAAVLRELPVGRPYSRRLRPQLPGVSSLVLERRHQRHGHLPEKTPALLRTVKRAQRLEKTNKAVCIYKEYALHFTAFPP